MIGTWFHTPDTMDECRNAADGACKGHRPSEAPVKPHHRDAVAVLPIDDVYATRLVVAATEAAIVASLRRHAVRLRNDDGSGTISSILLEEEADAIEAGEWTEVSENVSRIRPLPGGLDMTHNERLSALGMVEGLRKAREIAEEIQSGPASLWAEEIDREIDALKKRLSRARPAP